MKLYVRLEAPYEWVRVNGSNVEAFGEVNNLSEYPLSEEEELIAIVPGEFITAHRISLPAKSKRQFQSAVPYALEEAISEDVEELHFVCLQWKADQDNTVYVVAKQKMFEWQALANEHKLPIDMLAADHSLLPFHDAADCSIALVNNLSSGELQLLANHKNGYGVSLDPSFIDIWLREIPLSSTIAVNDQGLTEQLIEDHPDRDFRHWSFGSKLAHWLEHNSSNINDLYSDQYRPSVRHFVWQTFVTPLIIVGAAILLTFLYDSYRYFSLRSEIFDIDKEQQQIIKSSFPEIDYVEPSKERFMMEQALSRMGGGVKQANVQSMLSEITIVLRRQNVTLGTLVYRDSELVITCYLNSFSQVDKLTKQFNARPHIRARLQSSSQDEGRIIANYTITSD